MSNYPSYTYKLIVIGDNNSGKTSVTNRFVNHRFNPTYNTTIGVEFDAQNIPVTDKQTGQTKLVKLHIWDTAGQEQFRAITKSYYVDAIAAILVFDVTSRNSFKNLAYWLNEIKTHGKMDSQNIFLVGNKIDLDHRIQVTTDEAEAFVRNHKLAAYIPTSARSGTNVDRVFNRLSQQIYDAYPESYFVQNRGIVIPGVKSLNLRHYQQRKRRWWHFLCGGGASTH